MPQSSIVDQKSKIPSASGRNRTCQARRLRGYSPVGIPVPSDAVSSTGGIRTRTTPRFELGSCTVRLPCRRSSAPGGIRTRDLHLDRVASTPDCSTRACAVLSSHARAPGGSRTHSSTLARWQASRYITGACAVPKAPGRSRTCAAVLPRRQAAVTSQGRNPVSPPGIEPGLQPSEGRVRSGTPRGRREHLAGIEPATPVWKTGAFPATPQVHHSEARGT